ncbi:3038_t:CDS:2 [Entrophospora sp. SA101]|nr:3038_t:CDS:2 [Entrophospora sp. SA101]
MSQIRTELITPAVNFLKDPKVQSSPLQKRVAFLESKGLTSEEIEEALKQAKAGQIDWRDYFIAAVLIGGIGYAIKAIFMVNKFS